VKESATYTPAACFSCVDAGNNYSDDSVWVKDELGGDRLVKPSCEAIHDCMELNCGDFT